MLVGHFLYLIEALALVVFGLIALGKLQTDEFPDVAPPFVTVGIPYPGASPDGVEKEILDPVEEAISSISGVKTVTGTKLKSMAAGKMGYSTTQVGDLVADLVAKG